MNKVLRKAVVNGLRVNSESRHFGYIAKFPLQKDQPTFIDFRSDTITRPSEKWR